MTNELYYEEYDNVAVMFATIRNYDTEQVGIRVLNEIICDFDEVVSHFIYSCMRVNKCYYVKHSVCCPWRQFSNAMRKHY